MASELTEDDVEAGPFFEKLDLPTECCAKCRFAELMVGEPFLQDSEFRCRRYPPSVFIGAVGESDVDEVADNAICAGYFYAPYVTGDNWCGEFQPRKADAVDIDK